MNTKDPTAILLEILNIIDYQDDKDAFVKDFIGVIQDETVMKAAEDLDQPKKEALSKETEGVTDTTKLQEIILKYFSKEKFMTTLEETTKRLFDDYLETIYPTLPEEKKTALTTYLLSLTPAM